MIREVKFKFDFDFGHRKSGGEYMFTYLSARLLEDFLEFLRAYDSKIGTINKPSQEVR